MRTQIPSKQILDGGVDTADIKDAAVTDLKLSTTGVASGPYTKVVVNDKGRVVSASTPTTLAGFGIVDAQPLDSDVTALATTTTTGLYVITGVGTSTTRSLVPPAAGFTILNPSGVVGAPTFSLANDLGALESLATIGFGVRTASDTWATRNIAGTTGNIIVLNGSGAASDPTINLAPVGIAGTYESVTTDAFGRVISGGAGAALSLDGLSDVVITAPISPSTLNFNGTNWVNAATALSSAAAILNTWTLISGTNYYSDFAHNLGTTNIVITIFDTVDNSITAVVSTVLLSANVIRVTVVGNTRVLRVVAVANGQAIALGGYTPAAVITSINGVTVNTASSRLNFQGQAINVVDAGSGVTNIIYGSRFTFFAGSLDSPTSPDWAVNALAPTVSDPVNTAINVRQFNNTIEQGVGFLMTLPAGTINITIRVKGRAAAAPAAAAVVGLNIYIRAIPNGTAIGAWTAAIPLTNIAILTNATSTNAFYQYYTFTTTLASLGLTPGICYQVEFTRNNAPIGGTNLASNFLLAELSVGIS